MQLLRFFSFFFYFSVSFYPIWMKFLSKFRENVGLQAYRLGSVLNRSWTGPRTAVFSGLSQKNLEDRDCWSAWTGYSPVWFSVPFRSYEPDLEALFPRIIERFQNLLHAGCAIVVHYSHFSMCYCLRRSKISFHHQFSSSFTLLGFPWFNIRHRRGQARTMSSSYRWIFLQMGRQWASNG